MILSEYLAGIEFGNEIGKGQGFTHIQEFTIFLDQH